MDCVVLINKIHHDALHFIDNSVVRGQCARSLQQFLQSLSRNTILALNANMEPVQ